MLFFCFFLLYIFGFFSYMCFIYNIYYVLVFFLIKEYLIKYFNFSLYLIFCVFTFMVSGIYAYCGITSEEEMIHYLLRESTNYEEVHRCFQTEEGCIATMTVERRTTAVTYPIIYKDLPSQHLKYHVVAPYTHTKFFQMNSQDILLYLSKYYNIPLDSNSPVYKDVLYYSAQYKRVPLSFVIDVVLNRNYTVEQRDSILFMKNELLKIPIINKD